VGWSSDQACCVPHVKRSNEATVTAVRPLLGQPEG
jgi:hypothetical protein